MNIPNNMLIKIIKTLKNPNDLARREYAKELENRYFNRLESLLFRESEFMPWDEWIPEHAILLAVPKEMLTDFKGRLRYDRYSGRMRA